MGGRDPEPPPAPEDLRPPFPPAHHQQAAEAPMAGSAAVGALPCRAPGPRARDRLALRTAGITFHPVHYLTRRPFAHRFHDQSHGRGVATARGTQMRHKTNSAARVALRWGPSPAAASLGGWREDGFCVSGLAAAVSLSKRRTAAAGAATGRERLGGRGSVRTLCSVPAVAGAAVAPPLGSARLRPSRASVHGSHCRGSRR